MAMKKRTVRKQFLTPEQAEEMIAGKDERFCPEIDARLSEMIRAAIQRKIHVRYLWVDPARLVPHIPEVLDKAKVHLAEEPSMRESMLRVLFSDKPGALLTYRNEKGDLCSFDDYATLAVALDAKVQQVRVVVLGEGNEWYKAQESPIWIG